MSTDLLGLLLVEYAKSEEGQRCNREERAVISRFCQFGANYLRARGVSHTGFAPDGGIAVYFRDMGMVPLVACAAQPGDMEPGPPAVALTTAPQGFARGSDMEPGGSSVAIT